MNDIKLREEAQTYRSAQYEKESGELVALVNKTLGIEITLDDVKPGPVGPQAMVNGVYLTFGNGVPLKMWTRNNCRDIRNRSDFVRCLPT